MKAHEYLVRVRETIAPVNCETPATAFAYWQANISNQPGFDAQKETVIALFLNTRKRVIGHNLVSIGGLDQSLVHPREVFRPAIVAAAHSILLMHNHPSGDISPSEADVRWTKEFIRAGQLLRIALVDHLIVSDSTFLSLRSLGLWT